jgi:hypothetical protein
MMPRARRKPSALPGYEGKRDLKPVLVDAVYEKGKFEVVVRNIRESVLTDLYAHKRIDDAQLMAGTWFRRTYEAMRMGSMAVDPSREPVDTSGIADPIPTRMITAGQQLAAARAEIGKDGYRIVELVCGEGWDIRDASWKKTPAEILHTGWLLRICLDRLAQWRGYATKTT